ncbi:MAG TPA: peptidoglycan DD-metalloendopeptidase family protein [Thermoanaerobaculia bacterium]|nr:peptidoglycan DD-metalloendopeptidase family protein [Thermoanaerobaculia bacterium]
MATQAGDLIGRHAENRARSRLQVARLQEAEAALRESVAIRDASLARVAELEGALAERLALLRRRLLSMDRFAGQGYLRLFLDVDRTANLLDAIRQLRFLARRDAHAVAGYREARAVLEAEQGELRARVAEAERWVAAELERRQELERLVAEQKRLLAGLEERRTRLARSAGELGQREQRLSRLVELLHDESAAGLEGVPVDEFQGALDWPALGAVTTEFGPRTDPVYGTTLPHNGVEMATRREAPVATVYPGRVLFAAPFQDLGFTVVVEHPGRVLTLYAGLARLEVEEGDVLAFRSVVGRASERLYFEVRREKRAEDPRAWLR